MSTHPRPTRLWIVPLLALIVWPLFSAAADMISAGPLASHFPLTLTAGERFEALGPLFQAETIEDTDLTALPPLWSCTKNRALGSTEIDVLYPLFTYDRFGDEYRVQVLQLLSFAGGRAVPDTNAHRFTLFPFYFQQRSPNTDENYTAFFPFYGTLKKRLFRDEIHFVLWPAYAQTRKRDVVTDNFLVPFFHVRHGEGLRGWQFWPLYSTEHKEVTTRTNHWGDIEIVGGHDKHFMLWPLWIRQKLDLGTENPKTNLVMFPFFSRQRSPLRDATMVGLFSLVDDREKKYREWAAPWPFVAFAEGEGKQAARFWPLFGHAANETLHNDFLLWPLYKFHRLHSPPLDRERTRLLYLLYSDTTETNTETGRSRHRVDAWPFVSYRRDWDGSARWQGLALLEPLLPNSKSVERNYSPLWSLWRTEKNATTGASSQSLLWNLYREDRTATNTHGSFLFGLVRWRVTPEGRRAKWFYLPGETAY